MERVSRGLLNKFLHGPTVHLRNGGAGSPEKLDLFRRMFQLEDAPSDPAEAASAFDMGAEDDDSHGEDGPVTGARKGSARASSPEETP